MPSPLRLIDIDFIQNTPDNLRSLHRHEFHEALLIRSGRYQSRLLTDTGSSSPDGVDQAVEAGPGAVVYYPAGQQHYPDYLIDGALQMSQG